MNKMKAILVFLCVICLCSACNQNDETEKKQDEYTLYFINEDEMGFKKVYNTKKDLEGLDLTQQVNYMLTQLRYGKKNNAVVPIFIDGLELPQIYQEGSNVILDFSENYYDMTNIREILFRTAVVQTLVQIDGVDSVEFKIAGKPLLNTTENIVGPMNADTFLMSKEETGSNSQNNEVLLYFAADDGEHLVSYPEKIQIENNIPLEQAVLIKLIEGPKKDGYYAVLSKKTEVLKTSVKDGVCYVDFNQAVTEPIGNVSEEVQVKAIVNSLVELSNINKVQITIEGEKREKFRDAVGIDVPLERELEIYHAQ